jgi:hypothetical protein
MKNYFNKDKELHFVFPVDGDCLNQADGEIINGLLYINAQVKAPVGRNILINEKIAPYNVNTGYYDCLVPLKSYRTTLFAVDSENPDTNMRISVYKLTPGGIMKHYRISVDDNILFLQDIALNQSKYKSVFENPFLAIYKKAHDYYGTKVHMNLFYEFTDECMKFFGKHKSYFNLAMMPDKYKEEFKANSDWLRFSFHARANCPDYPYRNTSMEKLDEDIRLVHREMIRFIGEDFLSPVTTLHWGTTNIGGVRVLRNNGYKGLNGFFEFDNEGLPYVSYHYPKEVVDNLTDRDFWVDTCEDVVCSRCDLVLNAYKLPEIVPLLEKINSNPHRSGFLELLIHEQYFYEDYTAYIPKYADIVLTSAQWAYENGYKPSFLSEVMFDMPIGAYISKEKIL